MPLVLREEIKGEREGIEDLVCDEDAIVGAKLMGATDEGGLSVEFFFKEGATSGEGLADDIGNGGGEGRVNFF